MRKITDDYETYSQQNSFLKGGHIKIHLHSEIPVQVDGEPWVQSPCDVVVLKSALKVIII